MANFLGAAFDGLCESFFADVTSSRRCRVPRRYDHFLCQSVMKRGAVATTSQGPSDGSANGPEDRGAECL